jgi:hypothetical protein
MWIFTHYLFVEFELKCLSTVTLVDNSLYIKSSQTRSKYEKKISNRSPFLLIKQNCPIEMSGENEIEGEYEVIAELLNWTF